MWRCFFQTPSVSLGVIVCSTHVEMFLKRKSHILLLFCLLHACGDVSAIWPIFTYYIWFAPRMWRCFFSKITEKRKIIVCSTHVEMFPAQESKRARYMRLLHACGDVSLQRIRRFYLRRFAPRMWRCFPLLLQHKDDGKICSTHVEMFLHTVTLIAYDHCLLHACGDVSAWELVDQRPSVCSTHVEFFF